MCTSIRIALATCLLFLTAPLCAEEPVVETPPTPEEVQEALDKVSKWFTWGPSRPPAAPVKQPEWYPLEPEDAKRVEEVLSAWSASRAKGGRLRCQFRQWEYDPAFGPKDSSVPYVYTTGEFRWDAPNVWLWLGTSASKVVARGDKTEWVNEYPVGWARNRESIYEWNYRNKTRIERRFPDESGPGFGMFSFFGYSVPLGVNAGLLRLDPAGLQDRFWIRSMTPKEGSTDRWLELVPKKDADAIRFSSIVVVISESDWDIRALDIRAANYSESYPAHTTAEFVNRTNPATASLLTRVLGGSESCIPSVPAGWKNVIEDYRGLPSRK